MFNIASCNLVKYRRVGRYLNNIDAYLKFSYPPMTLYEFDQFKCDEEVYNLLSSTGIYIIAKRSLPIMSIIKIEENGIMFSVSMEKSDSYMEISISPKDNPVLLHDLEAAMLGNNTNDKNKFHAITLYGKNRRFILHANLDKLMSLSSDDLLKIHCEGDPVPFFTYEVLYVGQCTGEHIFSRFKTHHALLDILIKEKIIPEKYDKINDLVILPFRLEADVVSVITHETSEEDFVKVMMGDFGYGLKEISLDCEKALIRAMDPRYNKTKFKQYPKSKDGLYQHKTDFVLYRILENIILEYDESHKIVGDSKVENASIIGVNDRQEFFICS